MAVEFGDSSEPWSVGRGNVKRWLHCRVDVDVLPETRRDELHAWLAELGVTDPVETLLVTRGDSGYRIHLPTPLDVHLEDLPVWLQRTELPPGPEKPASVTRMRRK